MLDLFCSKGKNPEDVAYKVIEKMIDADTELITIYYGKDTEEEKASELAEKLEETVFYRYSLYADTA